MPAVPSAAAGPAADLLMRHPTGACSPPAAPCYCAATTHWIPHLCGCDKGCLFMGNSLVGWRRPTQPGRSIQGGSHVWLADAHALNTLQLECGTVRCMLALLSLPRDQSAQCNEKVMKGALGPACLMQGQGTWMVASHAVYPASSCSLLFPFSSLRIHITASFLPAQKSLQHDEVRSPNTGARAPSACCWLQSAGFPTNFV